jgi:hypothetical protein
MTFKSGGHGANFVFRGVIEMAPRTENFDGLEADIGNLAEKLGRQFSRDEHVGGKMSLHSVVCQSLAHHGKNAAVPTEPGKVPGSTTKPV